MSYSAQTFVADEQPTTAKWNLLWSNDASFNDGTGIGDDAILARHINDGAVLPNSLLASASSNNDWSWDTWTPSWSGYTIGNGTVNAKYAKIGGTVFYRILWTLGSTSAFGSSAEFSPPVAQDSAYPALALTPIGRILFSDGGAAFAFGTNFIAATGNITIRPETAGGTYVSLTNTSSTAPFSPASGDQVLMQGFYEAA